MIAAFLCDYCINMNDDKCSCKAFPEGIPNKIYYDDVRHIDNIDGDNGYKFELNENDPLFKKMNMSKNDFVEMKHREAKRHRDNGEVWLNDE